MCEFRFELPNPKINNEKQKARTRSKRFDQNPGPKPYTISTNLNPNLAVRFGCATDGHGSFDEIYAMTRAMPQGLGLSGELQTA